MSRCCFFCRVSVHLFLISLRLIHFLLLLYRNNVRPHSALNNLTPAQFAKSKEEREFARQNATSEGKLQLVS